MWPRASHYSGFSGCGAQALGHTGFRGCSTWAQQLQSPDSGAQVQYLRCTDLVAPRHVGSSRTRDRTHVSYLGRWIHQWATREAPRTTDLKSIIRSPASLSPSRQLVITELLLKPHWLTWTWGPAASCGQVCQARPPLPGLCSGLGCCFTWYGWCWCPRGSQLCRGPQGS